MSQSASLAQQPNSSSTPAAPEPGTRTADILARARDLAPRLRERIWETERLRHLPDVTIEEARNADILSMLLPVSLGGAGAELDEFIEVVRILAQGDPSAAWTIAFLCEHNWMLSRWPEQVQNEVFRDKLPVLMAGTFSPAPGAPPPGGVASRAEGGYVLQGHWAYATGIKHSDWVMLAGTVEGTPGPFLFLLPIEHVEVPDSWYMEGMRGTGSFDVKVDRRFVPEHHVMAFSDWMGRDNPGSRIHADPIVGYDANDLANFLVPTVILGAAEALLSDFRVRLEKRRAFASEKIVADTVMGQVRLARATAELRTAQALLQAGLRTVMGHNLQSKDNMPAELRANVKMDCLGIARHARLGVDIIAGGSGSGIYKSGDVTNHYMRDIRTLLGHLHIDEDAVFAKAGEALLGRLSSPVFF